MTLNLGKNAIGSEATLTTLNLGWNNIGDQGVKCLSHVIHNNQ
ncbi:unnamed protein product, partial [Rotaria sp. Silwood2]